MSFERIIRPFQTNEVSPPRLVLPESGQSAQIVKVQIGRSGGGKIFQGEASASQTVYNKKYPTETVPDA